MSESKSEQPMLATMRGDRAKRWSSPGLAAEIHRERYPDVTITVSALPERRCEACETAALWTFTLGDGSVVGRFCSACGAGEAEFHVGQSDWNGEG